MNTNHIPAQTSEEILPPIHIVLGSDEKFAQHLTVTMASILSNTKAPVEFHILHDGLHENTIRKISAVTRIYPAKINFVLLELNEFKDLPSRPNISLMTYSRVKIPALLPHLSRVLYLDCDIIVLGDLLTLWKTDLGTHPIGACLDYISPKKVLHLGLDPLDYFNAGVILMNLDLMRALDFNLQIVRYFNSPKRIFAHDQDLLNLIFSKNWKHLHSRWNMVVHHNLARSKRLKIYPFNEFSDAQKSPTIIHYTGIKPSTYLHDSPFKELYWQYLSLTEYSNYRYPPPPLRSIIKKWRRRAKNIMKNWIAYLR